MNNAPFSEICERACSILDSVTPGEAHQSTPFPVASDGVSSLQSTDGFGSGESLKMDTTNSSDSFDPSLWALPESFEEIVSKSRASNGFLRQHFRGQIAP